MLSNALDRSRLEFGIFCVDASINPIRNPEIEILSLSRRDNYPWRMVGEVSRAIDRFRPDVVHCWLPPSISVPGLIAAKLHGLPVVASYRNKKFFDLWIRVPEFISTALLSNRIVSNCSPQQSNYLFRKLYTWKAGILIPNAADVPDRYVRDVHANRSSEPLKFLFVGRLSAQKNWRTLLHALAQLPRDAPWQIDICGKGEDEAPFRELAARLGISSRVRMHGYQEDVYQFMTNSDLLVLPSWYEGTPNVLLEALTIGLPCLASDIFAHRELLGDSSIVNLFDPHDPSELAKSIMDFVEFPPSEEVIEQGRRLAGRYSVERILSMYSDFYRGIVEERKRGNGRA